MRLRWTPRAVADLEEISDYLLSVNPTSRKRLIDRIEAVATYLLQFPHMGKLGLASGTREFVLSGTPYILVFRLKDDVIQILSIRDGRMQLPPTEWE